MIQQTSLFSYWKLQGEGKIGRRQEQVKVLLEQSDDPLNNRQIAELLDLPINTITPRVKELRVKGIIEKAGVKFDPVTNRNVIFWRVNNN